MKLKLFTEGKVHEAIRASISIPGIFVPYAKDDMILVDGAVLERVPVKVLKDAGMDFVIGVDVSYNMTAGSSKSIFHVLFEVLDLMSSELFTLKKQVADIMIRVDTNDIDPTKFDMVDICEQRGAEAAEAAIPEILAGIEELEKKASEKCEKIEDM